LRLLAAFLLASTLAGAAPPGDIPCRNLKTAAQCAADDKARQGGRPSIPGDRVAGPVGAVPIERILVEADPEDLPLREKSRWEKLERALQGTIVTEWVGNDGVRMWCRDPCPGRVNCCGRDPGFNTTGRDWGS